MLRETTVAIVGSGLAGIGLSLGEGEEGERAQKQKTPKQRAARCLQILASRGGKRAQKTPNIPKSWGAEQKNPQLPQ